MLARAIVDRPLVNSALVLAGFAMLAITGLVSDEFSQTQPSTDYLASLIVFALGVVFIMLLPIALRAIFLGTMTARLAGLGGMISGLAILLAGPDWVGYEPEGGFSAENFLHLSAALGLMSWGVVWCPPLPRSVFVGPPVLVGALFAIAGLAARLGLFAQTPALETLIAAACVFAISLGTIIVTTLLLTFVQNRAVRREPRDRAIETVNGTLAGLIFGLALTAVMYGLSVVSAGETLFPLFLTIASAFAGIGALLVLPGSLWLLAKKPVLDGGADGGPDHAPDHVLDDSLIRETVDFEPPGFAAVWRVVRRFLPNPSAYGLIFVTAIFSVVITASNPLRPTPFETIFVLVGVVLAGIVFLSLRAFILATIMLTMSLIISSGLAGIDSAARLFVGEQLMAPALGVLSLFGVLIRFRDISAGEKRPRLVVSALVRTAIGPYALMCGSILGLLVIADLSGFWENAAMVATQFLVMVMIMLVLLPAVGTVLAARYGRF